MLGDMLKDLKTAQINGDEKAEKRLMRQLNSLGMDDMTIKILLKEIKVEDERSL